MKFKRNINHRLKQMAYTPKAQIKQLAIGTAISACSMLILTFVSEMQIPWLFYLLVTVTTLAILYAIPGYIGIWLWRMRQVLFRNDRDK